MKDIYILITYAIYITYACPYKCNDHDSSRTNCIHSFFQPSMKLVDCWDHSNRGEKGRLIFICPSQKAHWARRMQWSVLTTCTQKRFHKKHFMKIRYHLTSCLSYKGGGQWNYCSLCSFSIEGFKLFQTPTFKISTNVLLETQGVNETIKSRESRCKELTALLLIF